MALSFAGVTVRRRSPVAPQRNPLASRGTARTYAPFALVRELATGLERRPASGGQPHWGRTRMTSTAQVL
jgi:hypothetical protein